MRQSSRLPGPPGSAKTRVGPAEAAGGGFFAEVGAKSAGPWPGRPAGPGAFVRIGYRARLRRPLF